MNGPPPLLDRIKRTRIVQALAVYLGASWMVLQLVDVLQGMLGLTALVGPITVTPPRDRPGRRHGHGLGAVSREHHRGRGGRRELPTDWEVAPADALASLRAGRLPHLTWGSALLAGVVALSLLFGGAGLVVLVRGSPGLIGPAEAQAGSLDDGIAVLPFNVTAPDYGVYREGLIDLLSAIWTVSEGSGPSIPCDRLREQDGQPDCGGRRLYPDRRKGNTTSRRLSRRCAGRASEG